MVKKVGKVASILAAGALLFGGLFISCSDDDDDDDTPSLSITADATTAKTGTTVNLSASAKNFTPTEFTWTNATADSTDSSKATVTSDTEGEVEVSLSATGGSTTKTASIKITFSNSDTPAPSPTGDEKAYAWNFADITADDIGAETVSGGDYNGKYVLAADYKYKSTPEGIILTLGKGDASQGFVYNSIDPEKTVGESSQTAIYETASKGAVEPAGELLVLKNLTGPFTVEMIVSANSSSDKPDRYAYIKIGENEVAAPSKEANTLPVAGQTISYSYTGTDKVTVTLGCAKYMRVYDVKVTTDVAQDQSDGTVVTFTPQTNIDTANDVDTLGLVGTSVSPTDDAGTYANATIADGKISVTSKAEGTETITVTDANGKTASFKAVVAEDGTLSIGTITKFVRDSLSSAITTAPTTDLSSDGVVTITYDGLTDLEYSTDNETFVDAATVGLTVSVSEDKKTVTVSALKAGTYYVRAKASDNYAAIATKTIVLEAAGSALKWTVIGDENATVATFSSKAVTINKKNGIYLPVTYVAGKKVVLKFTVDKDSVNADSSNKIRGGFAFNDEFVATTKTDNKSAYAVFASNKGISNGSKSWDNTSGSSNGYGRITVGSDATVAAMYTPAENVTGAASATDDVTFTVTFTIGAETASGDSTDAGKVVVLNGTITDGTNSLTKDVKAREMKVDNVDGTLSTAAVPYIWFGDGKTDSITVSNITLTVDDVAVATSAD